MDLRESISLDVLESVMIVQILNIGNHFFMNHNVGDDYLIVMSAYFCFIFIFFLCNKLKNAIPWISCRLRRFIIYYTLDNVSLFYKILKVKKKKIEKYLVIKFVAHVCSWKIYEELFAFHLLGLVSSKISFKPFWSQTRTCPLRWRLICCWRGKVILFILLFIFKKRNLKLIGER